MHFKRMVEGGDLCAIFVHAGAGYHSTHNEKNHLKACDDAVKVGMSVLKTGGTAVDAVELALRLLEDREITNAGYGSNLTIDGHVECDACIVDHFGRSGAVGAISNVRNPIVVARLVLDASIQPLSLARVPPNLLVADGAKDFALSHGIDQLPGDFLVSEAARARWLNWRKDLLRAEAEQRKRSIRLGPEAIRHSAPATLAMGTSSGADSPTEFIGLKEHQILPRNISKHAAADGPEYIYSREVQAIFDDEEDEPGTDDNIAALAMARKRPRIDVLRKEMEDSEDTNDSSTSQAQQALRIPQPDPRTEHQEVITDTVGAIAVDCFGRIAAGSSSGGIGMKHKGRCGPAALVGISTAVIPADPEDPDEASVATVTSGTGEHMATTAAAQTAADRILSRTRKSHGRLESCTEDEALFSMIENDFMKHPGVEHSPCQGAIGILSVKKTKHGIYFYFGHNTDSFAVGSMHSGERKPACVMSRSKVSGNIAQGARAARARRAGKTV